MRYIDAEKIEIRTPYGINNDGEVLIPISAVRQSIARTPTEDVVKVVRCEKCKFFFDDCCNHPKNRVLHRVPDFGDHYVYTARIKCEPDHFCKYGERKDNHEKTDT